jgi:hypothetical protein
MLSVLRLRVLSDTQSMGYDTLYINVNVKVKLFLCITEHHAMKTYWGVEV